MRGLVAGRVAEHGVVLAAFYVVVVAVAGGSSIALLVWPSHSSSYFSWDLGAPSAAATIGGLYLASVGVFVVALTRPRPETRSLSVGVLALAVPTLWFTLSHSDVFEWTRPQAVAWVVLFVMAPISIGQDLRIKTRSDVSPAARPATRATLAAIALVGGGVAIALWSEHLRSTVSAHSPIPLVGLTGRYIGCWCTFLAASSATAAIRGRTSDARLVAALLGSVSIGTLGATARSASDLGPNVEVYIAALIGIGILAVALHHANRTPPTETRPS